MKTFSCDFNDKSVNVSGHFPISLGNFSPVIGRSGKSLFVLIPAINADIFQLFVELQDSIDCHSVLPLISINYCYRNCFLTKK